MTCELSCSRIWKKIALREVPNTRTCYEWLRANIFCMSGTKDVCRILCPTRSVDHAAIISLFSIHISILNTISKVIIFSSKTTGILDLIESLIQSYYQRWTITALSAVNSLAADYKHV